MNLDERAEARSSRGLATMTQSGGVTLAPFCHFGQVFVGSWYDSEIDTYIHMHAHKPISQENRLPYPFSFGGNTKSSGLKVICLGMGSITCCNHLFLPP